MTGLRIVHNGVVKSCTVFVTMVVELSFARFLVKKLGVDLYGVMLLATNIVAFGEIVKIIIVSTTGRFTSIAYHQKKTVDAVKTFNVTFLGCCIISLLFFEPISAAISYFIPSLLKIPNGYEYQTRLLFFSVFTTFLLLLNSAVLSIGTFIHNRIDLSDITSFSRLLVSRFLTVLLIVYAGFELSSLSAGILMGGAWTVAVSYYLKKKLTPELVVSAKFWDSTLFWSMNSFGGWVALRQVGARIMIFSDIIIVNKLFGPTESGLYGIALFFASKLRLIGGTFSGLVNPVILRLQAEGDTQGIVFITNCSIRIMGIIFALPVGLLCGLYQPILSYWVGPEYAHLHLLAILLTFHISITTSCYPLFAIQDAYGRVKVPGLVGSLISSLYICFSVILSQPSFHLGTSGIAIAGAGTIIFNHSVFNPMYTAKILGQSPIAFYKPFFPGLLGLTGVFGTSHYLCGIFASSTFGGLLFLVSIISIGYAVLGWFFLLANPERNFIQTNFFSRIRLVKINHEK